MSGPRICAYEECSEPFIPTRPHQRFHSEPCRYAQWELDQARGSAEDGAQRVDGQATQPLQAVRDQRTVSRHDRDLGGLIRQAIVDRIKTTGECFPDDLIPLYPEGEVDRCRELATAQFGSLAASRKGREPLIREKGRRKSSIPARKGAKASVWEFTPAGRIHYGLSASPPTGSEGEIAAHGASRLALAPDRRPSPVGVSAGVGEPGPSDGPCVHPGGPSSGGSQSRDERDQGRQSPSSSAAAGPPDRCIDAGPSTGGSGDEGAPPITSSAAGVDAELLTLDDSRPKTPSAYDPWAA